MITALTPTAQPSLPPSPLPSTYEPTRRYEFYKTRAGENMSAVVGMLLVILIFCVVGAFFCFRASKRGFHCCTTVYEVRAGEALEVEMSDVISTVDNPIQAEAVAVSDELTIFEHDETTPSKGTTGSQLIASTSTETEVTYDLSGGSNDQPQSRGGKKGHFRLL